MTQATNVVHKPLFYRGKDNCFSNFDKTLIRTVWTALKNNVTKIGVLTFIRYSQSFVYCRVFVLLIIDYSTKKGVLVYSRKRASEIVNFRSNQYRKQCELRC